MSWYPEQEIPTVAVCNIAETFYDFLQRAGDEATRTRLIRERQYKGDRALLWLGGPKLVVASFPIPHADWLCRRFDYGHTQCLAPADPSPWLSLDILREPSLLRRLVEYAGTGRVVRLIPYATTRAFLHLVEVLRREHGLTVLLPESPAVESLWVRDYVDTKAGFRALASRWLPDGGDLLPEGIPCTSFRMAAEVVCWFCRQGRTCIVKADDGENGIGSCIYRPTNRSPEAIACELADSPFLRAGGIMVEEFVHSPGALSPSLEVFVPPLGSGEPFITYLSNQVFTESGNFGGVLVSKALYNAPWYLPLADAGLRMATGLQQMGYVGHFDMDAIVDDGGRLALLEVNSRRTGGTHVHEFALHCWGANYLDEVVLLSNDVLPSKGLADFAALHETLDDLLYPMAGQQQGVVLSITSSLPEGHFGAIFVGPTVRDVLALQKAVAERVRVASRQIVT